MDSSFTTPDGVRLALWRHLPDGPVRAHVYLLHGFGEHSGRYGRLASELNARGIALHAADHRGHGLSGGRRAWVPGPRALAGDWAALLAAEPPSRVPRFLFGHSMGGAVATQLALDAGDSDSFSGLILSSPYLLPAQPPSRQLRSALRLLQQALPGVTVERISSEQLSRQPEEAAAYDADPLVHHGGVSARSAHSLLVAGEEVLARAGELQLPLLVLHGAQDAIAGIAGSRQLLARAGSRDRRIVEFEAARHEVMNDLDRAEFYRVLLDWLDDRLEPG